MLRGRFDQGSFERKQSVVELLFGSAPVNPFNLDVAMNNSSNSKKVTRIQWNANMQQCFTHPHTSGHFPFAEELCHMDSDQDVVGSKFSVFGIFR